MLELVYQNDAGERTEIPLTPDAPVTIGRNPGSSLQTNNKSVSRAHAKIYRSGPDWMVEDLGSSNKTFVNGTEVNKAAFQPGDSIRFGELAAKVQEVADAPAAAQGGGRAEERRRRQEDAERRREERRQRRDASRVDVEAPPQAGETFTPERQAPLRPVPEPVAAEPVRRRREPPKPVVQEPVAEEPLDPREQRRQERERRIAERRASRAGGAPAKKARAPEPKPEPKPKPAPVRAEPKESAREKRQAERERRSRRDVSRNEPSSSAHTSEDDGESGVKLRRAQQEVKTLRGRIEEYQTRIDELETRCRDLESREDRHTEELDGWHERYNRAREQVDHAQQLVEETREDLKEKTEESEELEARVAYLEGDIAGQESSRVEGASLIGELKSKVVQKDRRIDELQRELDLMEYDLRQAREELDSLQDSFNHDNSEQRKLDRELQLLREVISEKENVISELKIEIEDQSREVYDLKMGTGVKDLEEAKRDVLEKYFEKNREVDELNERVMKLEHKLGESRASTEELEDRLEERKDITQHPDYLRKVREVERAQSDMTEAQEEVERLMERLDDFGPEAKGKLDAQINFLERKNDAIQEKLDSATTALATAQENAPDEGVLDSDELRAELHMARSEITDLKEDIERLETDLESAEEKAASAGDSPTAASTAPPESTGEVRAAVVANVAAVDQLESVMDVYTGWKVNINLLKTYVGEASDEAQEGGDISGAVDSIAEVLQVLLGDAGDLKDELKELEAILEKSG